MAEGKLHWENRNFTNAENLKLGMAQKLNLTLSILVVYPHLNLGEWVFSLVRSHCKLDSMVGGGTQGQ